MGAQSPWCCGQSFCKPRGGRPAARPRPCSVSGAAEARGGQAGGHTGAREGPGPQQGRVPSRAALARAERAAPVLVPRGTRAEAGTPELRPALRDATPLHRERLEGAPAAAKETGRGPATHGDVTRGWHVDARAGRAGETLRGPRAPRRGLRPPAARRRVPGAPSPRGDVGPPARERSRRGGRRGRKTEPRPALSGEKTAALPPGTTGLAAPARAAGPRRAAQVRSAAAGHRFAVSCPLCSP